MLRALLIALLLANLAVWAWRQPAVAHALSLPGPDSQREPERLARQVNPQAVRRVSVGTSATAAAVGTASAAPAASAAAGGERCLQAGPLTDEAFAQAIRQLARLGLRSDQWQDTRRESPGRWMVVMGPYKTRELLLRKQVELRGLKLPSDEISNPARLSPGLSLGQFGSPDEARARLSQVTRQGARSARVETLEPARVAHLLRVDHLPAAQAQQLVTAAAGASAWQACGETP